MTIRSIVRAARMTFRVNRWPLSESERSIVSSSVQPWTPDSGLQKGGARLMEAWYRTSTTASDAGARWVEVDGRPLILPETSNYVGPAVLTTGGRVVWWTVVGDLCRYRTGAWSYIYQLERGAHWQGPVSTPLVTGPFVWDALGYVHVAFKSAHTISLIGQLCTMHCPGPNYRAAVAEFHLATGGNLFLTLLALPGSTQSSAGDIWVDRRTGDAHVRARAASDGRVGYYCKFGGEPWGSEPLPVAVFEDAYRSRFTVDAPEGRLFFIKGGVHAPGAVEVRAVGIPAVRGAIDWKAVEARRPRLPADGFGTPAAIYVQREDQQTTECEGLFYALCGSPMANPLPHDNLIIHVNPFAGP